MKSASAGLLALLNSKQSFLMADLYTFTLAGGTVLRYTEADTSIVTGSNLMTYSEEFDNAAWSGMSWGGGRTVTTNDGTVVDPMGGYAADKFVTTLGAAGVGQGYSTISGTTYTFSVWVKTDAAGSVLLLGRTTNDGSNGTNPVTGDTCVFADGWKRCKLTYTETVTGTRYFGPAQYTLGSATWVFGAQFEVATKPGNYAMTTAAPVVGNTFDGGSVLIERSKIRTIIGVEVDTLDVTLHAQPTHLVGATPILQALRAGLFDAAQVKLERVFMPTWGDTSLGTMILFAGLVADMDIGRFKATLRVNSNLQRLNVQLPRNLYQPGCLNTLFDGNCTLGKGSFGVASSATSGSTTTSVHCGLGNPSGYFDLGTITFGSGTNAGLSVSVKQFAAGVFTLAMPLISAPAVGDTFTAYPGCDKSQATCTTKFNNLPNFRGQPYVPSPDTVL